MEGSRKKWVVQPESNPSAWWFRTENLHFWIYSLIIISSLTEKFLLSFFLLFASVALLPLLPPSQMDICVYKFPLLLASALTISIPLLLCLCLSLFISVCLPFLAAASFIFLLSPPPVSFLLLHIKALWTSVSQWGSRKEWLLPVHRNCWASVGFTRPSGQIPHSASAEASHENYVCVHILSNIFNISSSTLCCLLGWSEWWLNCSFLGGDVCWCLKIDQWKIMKHWCVSGCCGFTRLYIKQWVVV